MITVSDQYQNASLSSQMHQELVKLYLVDQEDMLVCWPTPVGISDMIEHQRLENKQISFFHKNGFRRIGRTVFFSYSPDPTHPSHSIAIADDADKEGANLTPSILAPLRHEEVAKKYLLHATIFSIQGKKIINFIKAHHQVDAASIHQADYAGFMPIHIAIQRLNVEATRTLIDLGVVDDLRSDEN
ncbi:hypothetical protein H0H81_005754 [Sphagnurus paluster]|uniref:Ankyrin repeat domain-containing protein n=1 Tax=Sphagnurus paluster TaxID=117069 RepID=A0A9P7GLI6_9AGAR|nr:hypothetical protein H0H81_005754 [Sphagnurus paluster]